MDYVKYISTILTTLVLTILFFFLISPHGVTDVGCPVIILLYYKSNLYFYNNLFRYGHPRHKFHNNKKLLSLSSFYTDKKAGFAECLCGVTLW